MSDVVRTSAERSTGVRSPIDRRRLAQMARTAAAWRGGPYLGESYDDISRGYPIKEPGLILTADDVPLTQLYAALAVYTWDAYTNLPPTPGPDPLLTEIIKTVGSWEEQAGYGFIAFPYDHPGFPYLSIVNAFPQGLAAASAAGNPMLKPLGSRVIMHEWVVKPGKRLFTAYLSRFGAELRQVVCGKGGPYEQLHQGKLTPGKVTVVVAAKIVTVGFASQAITPVEVAYPIAVLIAVILIKAGLNIFCESAPPRRRLDRKRRS